MLRPDRIRRSRCSWYASPIAGRVEICGASLCLSPADQVSDRCSSTVVAMTSCASR